MNQHLNAQPDIHFRVLLPTISDVDDPVEDVVGGGRVGDLRDAESAERSMQQMRSNPHHHLLRLGTFLALAHVHLKTVQD